MRGLGAGAAWERKMVCPGREGPSGEEVHATADWESALKHRCEVEVLVVVGVGVGGGCSCEVVEVEGGGGCSWEVVEVGVVRKGMV